MTMLVEEGGKDKSKASEETHAGGDIYVYKDSGIRERHGAVPIWLQLVAYGLIIWGIYYTIRYWSTE